jgi:probable HAF family extracellular repeat protein
MKSLTIPLALLFASPLPSAAAAQIYHLTDLGTLPGGTQSCAAGINGSGQVVGYASTNGSGAFHAFLYSGGTMIDLGTFGGSRSQAYGINDSGGIVGAYIPAGGTAERAFRYSGGVFTNLGLLPGTSNSSQAYAINASGQAVGHSGTNGLTQRGFLYSGGPLVDLGTLSGGIHSHAHCINNSGQIAGYSQKKVGSAGGSPIYAEHAFSYSGGSMTDLGTLPGGSNSRAYGINDSGQIVGYGDIDITGDIHAFLYSNGSMTDLTPLLPTYNSQAYDINNNGEIVGYLGAGFHHPFILRNGTVSDLTTLIDDSASGWNFFNWTTTQPGSYSINDAGWIAGTGTAPDGQPHAYLLTPAPEPNTLAMLTATALALRRRRGLKSEYAAGSTSLTIEYMGSREYRAMEWTR